MQEGSGETCDPPESMEGIEGCRDDCTACGDGIINGDPLEECE